LVERKIEKKITVKIEKSESRDYAKVFIKEGNPKMTSSGRCIDDVREVKPDFNIFYAYAR
jgi:hypothetical protein